jgi:hypothetical protein
VRLLELVYGDLQPSAHISDHALYLLQLSLNLLQRPREALEQLFGLDTA